MRLSPFATRLLAAAAALAVIGLLRFKPWQTGAIVSASQREKLTVGFLPVT